MLGALDQASVVWHHFVLGKVESKLQGHQHWEFKGDQLSPVQPKLLFQFLQQQEKKKKTFVNEDLTSQCLFTNDIIKNTEISMRCCC